MDDHDDEDDAYCNASQESQDGPPRWRKPALLFAIALVSGAIVSGLWLKLHPRPVATLASDAAVTLDPARRALPAPMPGGSTNLPPPSTPAPGAPQLVSKAPDAAVAESSAVDEAASGAETEQGMAPPATGPESAAVSTAGSDTGPQVLERFPPPYPPEALRERVEGTVRLALSIDAQGNVTTASVTRSSGSAELDHAAAQAVRGWRYRPAMHDGQPVASMTEVPIDFRLEAQ